MPMTVSVFASIISTPLLLRSAKYSFSVIGSNQLMSTLQRLLGLLSRVVTKPPHGAGLVRVGGGGICGIVKSPPVITQFEVMRLPFTPKLAASSASESAESARANRALVSSIVEVKKIAPNEIKVCLLIFMIGLLIRNPL